MFKKSLLLVLIAMLLVFGAFGCGQDATPPADDEGEENGEEPAGFEGQVLLGIMVPTTGSVAENGIDMENAAKLAVSEINAAGGVMGYEIITTTGDDGCDPSMATAAASKLVSEEVVGLVGGYCSGATLPTLKIYGDAGIPFVIAAANATTLIDENPGWTFMINSTGDMQAENAISWFEKQGVDTIGLIDDGSAFSADLKALTKAQWEAKGYQVLTDDTVTVGEQDFSALVTTIMSASPGGIYWTAYHAEGALITKQLREAGYEGVIIVADGSSAPAFIELAGASAEGVFCTAPPFADFLPAAQDFLTGYKAMFNRDPGAYAGLTYDATYLLVDAIERAGSFEGEAIRDALAATDGFEGISGAVLFTDKNTLGRSNFVILVAQDGKWTLAE
jgi:branched-chain amino acid transport system substrate-binding protein